MPYRVLEIQPTPNPIELVDLQLDVERIVAHLSKRASTIVRLKAAGYAWKHIARLFGTSVASAKGGFWREVRRARGSLMNGHRP